MPLPSMAGVDLGGEAYNAPEPTVVWEEAHAADVAERAMLSASPPIQTIPPGGIICSSGANEAELDTSVVLAPPGATPQERTSRPSLPASAKQGVDTQRGGKHLAGKKGRAVDYYDIFLSYRVDADAKLVEELWWRYI